MSKTFPISADNRLGNPQSRCQRLGWFLLGTFAFALSYTQAPLYFSNQNQYFLHGMARAGLGALDEDWLANTLDPTPVFSALVAVVGGWLHEAVFYVIQWLLLGLYFWSLLGIAGRWRESAPSTTSRWLLAALLVVVHAGILRLASVLLTGVDYPWFLQAGVAGQYLLGFGLQPSVFGVFLLVSVYAYLCDRPGQAAAWACAAAVLHATYLLAAAMLVLSYQMLLVCDGRWRQALLVGLGALLLVSPTILYSLTTFGPSDPAAFAEAQRILAHVRIPHHTEPERWFDMIALGQVAWMVLAIALTWRTRLFVILTIVFTLSLVLTIVQLATQSDTLALLFPWRTAALLMPLASTVILARLIGLGEALWTDQAPRPALLLHIACGTAIGLCVVGGLAINVVGWGYHVSLDEQPLLLHIARSHRPGDTYLLPVEIPKTVAGARGAASRNKNFTPAPRRGAGGPHIAVDLQSFRLSTGAAIYVDFKSIPYQDQDVLEWHRRLRWAERIYATVDWSDPAVLQELKHERITHVVTPAIRPLRGALFDLVYEDAAYRLYQIAK